MRRDSQDLSESARDVQIRAGSLSSDPIFFMILRCKQPRDRIAQRVPGGSINMTAQP
jgi:hypothetical protein